MHRRDLVAEDVLGGRQLALGIGRVTLGGQHGAERGGGIGAEPAAAAADAADERLGLLGVDARGRSSPSIRRDEREGRPRERVSGRPSRGVGMIDRPRCRGPRGIEVAGEVEGARVAGERGHEDLVGARLGELDGPPTVQHGPADVAVDRLARTMARDRLDVRGRTVRDTRTCARSARRRSRRRSTARPIIVAAVARRPRAPDAR